MPDTITTKELTSELKNVNKNLSVIAKQRLLITLRQFCEIYLWPSESAMRSYVYRAHELNLDTAFIRVRRRVLVDPEKFFLLIEELDNRFKKGGDSHETMCPKKRKAHL